jgi:acyl-homoserine-lactone acylase
MLKNKTMQKLFLLITFTITFTFTQAIEINTKNIQIIRDKYGVPHIYGKTDEEVAYGLAWATCEDDIKSMRENF